MGAWGIGGVGAPDADGLYNKAILAGYANTVDGGREHFGLTGISYSQYNVIVYFSSDTTDALEPSPTVPRRMILIQWLAPPPAEPMQF